MGLGVVRDLKRGGEFVLVIFLQLDLHPACGCLISRFHAQLNVKYIFLVSSELSRADIVSDCAMCVAIVYCRAYASLRLIASITLADIWKCISSLHSPWYRAVDKAPCLAMAGGAGLPGGLPRT